MKICIEKDNMKKRKKLKYVAEFDLDLEYISRL